MLPKLRKLNTREVSMMEVITAPIGEHAVDVAMYWAEFECPTTGRGLRQAVIDKLANHLRVAVGFKDAGPDCDWETVARHVLRGHWRRLPTREEQCL